jgi:precorrin-6Y C5,15-methyltransferase (decarboxylating)
LACLGILPGDTVWDIGAGSGAVSIDASRLAWRGRVFAVEPKPARAAAIRVNRKRCRACTVEIVEGLFPDCLAAASLPRPQRIFLGGGLGGASEKAEALLRSAWDQLLPGGRLAAHCVLLASLERARAVLGALAGEVAVSVVTAAESTPLAGDLRLQALNPVFLVTARK